MGTDGFGIKGDSDMPLVTSKQMLLDARKGHYAVGAFNVENMEMVKAVLQAAEEMRAPVILQTTPSTVRYGNLESYFAIVSAEAKKVSVPVCLHLDHGDSFALAVQAIRAGYTSIMIDGSGKIIEENIKLTQRVVEAAKACGIPVEAELGQVGGKEDNMEAAGDTYTDPEEAKKFVQRTGVSSLAIAIGTAHGFYAKAPVLDKERVSQIRNCIDIPLVLHGASGLSDEDVRECIARGICKVNYATELRVAYTMAGKKVLAEKPDTFDPKKPGMAGINAVKELVKNRISICGCAGMKQELL